MRKFDSFYNLMTCKKLITLRSVEAAKIFARYDVILNENKKIIKYLNIVIPVPRRHPYYVKCSSDTKFVIHRRESSIHSLLNS